MHFDFRNEWLAKFGQRLSTPTLAFDAAGLCEFTLNEAVAVTIYKPAGPTLLIVFGQIPVKHLPPQVMQKMLIENRNHSKYTVPVLSLS
jgi:hypothetical protein